MRGKKRIKNGRKKVTKQNKGSQTITKKGHTQRKSLTSLLCLLPPLSTPLSSLPLPPPTSLPTLLPLHNYTHIYTRKYAQHTHLLSHSSLHHSTCEKKKRRKREGSNMYKKRAGIKYGCQAAFSRSHTTYSSSICVRETCTCYFPLFITSSSSYCHLRAPPPCTTYPRPYPILPFPSHVVTHYGQAILILPGPH